MRTLHLAGRRTNAAVRALVIAIGISTTAAAAGAQQPAAQQPVPRETTEPLPFRRGQWGMDFGLGATRVYRIGAVRFTSPTRAWILDGRIGGQIDNTEYEVDPDSVRPVFAQNTIAQGGSMSLLVGRRAYRAMGTRAMRTVSFSVGGGFGYDETLSEGRRLRRSMNTNATAEGAIGAHYRLTPSLALGGNMRLGATYTWADNRQEPVRQRFQRVDFGLGASELVLSLFF